jgi:hypothetical protein
MQYKQTTREYKKKIPLEARFSALVQTVLGANPALYTMGAGSLSRG